MKLYFVVIYGGVEPSIRGPFRSNRDLKREASRVWRECNPDKGDNIFKLSYESGCPAFSSFVQGELD